MKLTSRKQAALNDVCTLIKTEYIPDEIGNDTPLETRSDVFCGIFSISGAEHYKAAQVGLRADLGVVISEFDDNGAEFAEVRQKRYTIYRRYLRGDGYVELYLRESQGNE